MFMKVTMVVKESLDSCHVWTTPSWLITLTHLSALRGLCAGLLICSFKGDY
jgi:hypothetical protein